MAVNITRKEYHMLLKDSREYRLLCFALYQAGTTREAIEALVRDDFWSSSPSSNSSTRSTNEKPWERASWRPSTNETSTFEDSQSKPFYDKFGHGSSWTVTPPLTNDVVRPHVNLNPSRPSENHRSSDQESACGDLIDEDDGFSVIGNASRKVNRQGHTVQLAFLPEDVTYKEITSLVRGGRLVEVYLRVHDRAADITFVNELAAANFLTYAKRNDLYVRTKRIEVSWSERQYVINEGLARNILNGASRNMLIHGACTRRLSEEIIRSDMEHIHGLVIIDVVVKGLDIYVETNSVRNCMSARSCMMSRFVYKGLNIEWHADECAGLLPEVPSRAKQSPMPIKILSRNKGMPVTGLPQVNRFGLLSLDDSASEDGSEESSNSDDDNESHISGIRLRPRSAASSSSG